ncbi:hypothetical protein ACWEF6_18950 [Amycolatopsis sp. NPDC004772]
MREDVVQFGGDAHPLLGDRAPSPGFPVPVELPGQDLQARVALGEDPADVADGQTVALNNAASTASSHCGPRSAEAVPAACTTVASTAAATDTRRDRCTATV